MYEGFGGFEGEGRSANHPLILKYGKCIELSDGLESTLWLFPDSALIIKKGNSQKDVTGEAVWISQLPEEIRNRFPRIVSIDYSDNSYLMEAYPYESVSSLLNHCRIATSEAFQYWLNGFKVFLSYRKSFEQAAPVGWEKQFLHKAQARLQRLRRQSSHFAEISKHEFLSINDHVYLNAHQVLNRITYLLEMDTSSSLKSPFLTLLHLDLQFSNILASKEGILIDPTGSPMGDPLYDFMKAVHSVDNEYIKNQYLQVSERKTVKSIPEFEVCLLKSHCRDDSQRELTEKLENWANSCKDELFDGIFVPQWPLRFWYQYATTMAGGTLLLFESKDANNLQKSITRYVISVVYLNNFISFYLDFLASDGLIVDERISDGICALSDSLSITELSSIIVSLNLINS